MIGALVMTPAAYLSARTRMLLQWITAGARRVSAALPT